MKVKIKKFVESCLTFPENDEKYSALKVSIQISVMGIFIFSIFFGAIGAYDDYKYGERGYIELSTTEKHHVQDGIDSQINKTNANFTIYINHSNGGIETIGPFGLDLINVTVIRSEGKDELVDIVLTLPENFSENKAAIEDVPVVHIFPLNKDPIFYKDKDYFNYSPEYIEIEVYTVRITHNPVGDVYSYVTHVGIQGKEIENIWVEQ